MKKTFKEIIELDDKIITITHDTGFFSMFFHTVIKPFVQPLLEIGYNIKYKMAIGALYGIFAYFQNLFETETIIELFQVPVGLVEGLALLVMMDFAAGTIRAITDSRIRFHPKKWTKTFNKIVMYSFGIVSITVGANMFPTAFGWLQYAAFLVATGHEIWSVAKHVKFTALLLVAIEIAKSKK